MPGKKRLANYELMMQSSAEGLEDVFKVTKSFGKKHKDVENEDKGDTSITIKNFVNLEALKEYAKNIDEKDFNQKYFAKDLTALATALENDDLVHFVGFDDATGRERLNMIDSPDKKKSKSGKRPVKDKPITQADADKLASILNSRLPRNGEFQNKKQNRKPLPKKNSHQKSREVPKIELTKKSKEKEAEV